MRLFIYGTLKRGGANHARLAGQQYLGEARTAAGFTLYSLGDYPGLVADPSDRAGVSGELWRVDAACLDRLDAFEGLTEGLYVRAAIALAAPPDTAAVETYFYARSVAECIPLGRHWRV
jgi:gamma-glutamylcyclotransferase (GGCT)/AIG2-like uncharacterized protein YtfP